MTDTERIAAIEERLDRTEQRLSVLEREHESFLVRFFGPIERTALTEMQETFALTMSAVDARLAELAAGGALPEEARAAIVEVLRSTQALITGIVGSMRAEAENVRTMAGTIGRMTDSDETMFGLIGKLSDRVAAIEQSLLRSAE